MKHLLLGTGAIAHMNSKRAGCLIGEEMCDAETLIGNSGQAVLIESEVIVCISEEEELVAEYAPGLSAANIEEMRDGEVRKFQSDGIQITHAGGNAIVPGLVDAHTHLLWTGDRSREVRLRQKGYSYAQIAEQGGGIGHTVHQTRNASDGKLLSVGMNRLNEALRNGTTAIEGKSGYGLDTKSELRLLRIMQDLKGEPNLPSIDITWMGAHDAPPGSAEKSIRLQTYVDELLTEQLPAVVQQGIARSCDVFCESGWFTTEQTSDIITASTHAGLSGRLHIDEFSDGGGATLAAELGVETADHALYCNENARAELGESGCVQGFLPAAPHTMGMDRFPPLQQSIEEKWPWTLSTDFNPNCRILSLPFIASLSVQRCGVDPLAALAAVTRNSATTVYAGDDVVHGVIKEGAIASMNIVNGANWEGWCLQPGTSPFKSTILRGDTVIH